MKGRTRKRCSSGAAFRSSYLFSSRGTLVVEEMCVCAVCILCCFRFFWPARDLRNVAAGTVGVEDMDLEAAAMP